MSALVMSNFKSEKELFVHDSHCFPMFGSDRIEQLKCYQKMSENKYRSTMVINIEKPCCMKNVLAFNSKKVDEELGCSTVIELNQDSPSNKNHQEEFSKEDSMTSSLISINDFHINVEYTTTDCLNSNDENTESSISPVSSGDGLTDQELFDEKSKCLVDDDKIKNSKLNIILHRLPGEDLGMDLSIRPDGTALVMHVQSNGPADRSSDINGNCMPVRIDDQITEINNVELKDLSKNEVVSILKELPLKIMLTIHRPYPSMLTIKEQKRVNNDLVTIPLPVGYCIKSVNLSSTDAKRILPSDFKETTELQGFYKIQRDFTQLKNENDLKRGDIFYSIGGEVLAFKNKFCLTSKLNSPFLNGIIELVLFRKNAQICLQQQQQQQQQHDYDEIFAQSSIKLAIGKYENPQTETNSDVELYIDDLDANRSVDEQFLNNNLSNYQSCKLPIHKGNWIFCEKSSSLNDNDDDMNQTNVETNDVAIEIENKLLKIEDFYLNNKNDIEIIDISGNNDMNLKKDDDIADILKDLIEKIEDKQEINEYEMVEQRNFLEESNDSITTIQVDDTPCNEFENPNYENQIIIPNDELNSKSCFKMSLDSNDFSKESNLHSIDLERNSENIGKCLIKFQKNSNQMSTNSIWNLIKGTKVLRFDNKFKVEKDEYPIDYVDSAFDKENRLEKALKFDININDIEKCNELVEFNNMVNDNSIDENDIINKSVKDKISLFNKIKTPTITKNIQSQSKNVIALKINKTTTPVPQVVKETSENMIDAQNDELTDEAIKNVKDKIAFFSSKLNEKRDLNRLSNRLFKIKYPKHKQNAIQPSPPKKLNIIENQTSYDSLQSAYKMNKPIVKPVNDLSLTNFINLNSSNSKESDEFKLKKVKNETNLELKNIFVLTNENKISNLIQKFGKN